MRLNDNSRLRLRVIAVTDVDSTTSTVALAVDGTEYPCTWEAAPTSSGGTWTRSALTDGYFCGPTVPVGQVGGATVLQLGYHFAEVRVTIGATIIAAETEYIQVS